MSKAKRAANRKIGLPRETVVMLLFRHYSARFDGVRCLRRRYPRRVREQGVFEQQVLRILQNLTAEELACEVASLVRPTTAYLEAAGVAGEEAMAIHLGEDVNWKVFDQCARNGILPKESREFSVAWWGARSGVRSKAS